MTNKNKELNKLNFGLNKTQIKEFNKIKNMIKNKKLTLEQAQIKWKRYLGFKN